MNADFSSRKLHETQIIEEKIVFFSVSLFKIAAGRGIFIKCFLPKCEHVRNETMKYAILSDIHANLEALETALARCRELAVDSYLSLGDIVGYNANPHECLEIMRSLPVAAFVKGNHDEYASNGDTVMAGFNPHAKSAVLWTQNMLSEEEQAFLAGLPYKMQVRGTPFTAVHASLDSPSEWGYIFDIHQAMDNFSYQYTQICFCGHSHVPIAYCKKMLARPGESPVDELKLWSVKPDEEGMMFRSDEADEIVLPIQPGCKYLVNVGSVGQPRNRDPRASFAVYDTEQRTLTRYRLPYDIAGTQEKIRAAGLPECLATRLEHGM